MSTEQYYGAYPFHEHMSSDQEHGFLPVHMGFRGMHEAEVNPISNARRPERDYLFHYTTAGCGLFWEDGAQEKLELPAGSAFLIPVPSATSYSRKPQSSWEMQWIFFRGSGATDLSDALIKDNGSYVFNNLRHGPCESALNRLLHLAYQGDVHPARASGLLCEILHGLHFQERSLPNELERACEFMHAHLANPDLSIDDVADCAGLSRAHFTRIFHKHLQQAPIAWLTEQRLKRAVDLLCIGRESIKSIARQAGFREAAYFSNVFKKHYGYAPGYLKKMMGTM